MKELDTTILKRGFIYTQLKANGAGYVYAQTDKHTERVVGYEVFKRRENKPHVWGEIEYPASVAFPGNEDFGNWAWTYRELADAEKKLSQLSGTAIGIEAEILEEIGADSPAIAQIKTEN